MDEAARSVVTISDAEDIAKGHEVTLSCGHEMFLVERPVTGWVYCPVCLAEVWEKRGGRITE